MAQNPNEMTSICCGKCLITISRRKAVALIGWCLMSAWSIGLVSCLIITGARNKIASDIDNSLSNLNESDISDYEFQTKETLLVGIKSILMTLIYFIYLIIVIKAINVDVFMITLGDSKTVASLRLDIWYTIDIYSYQFISAYFYPDTMVMTQ